MIKRIVSSVVGLPLVLGVLIFGTPTLVLLIISITFVYVLVTEATKTLFFKFMHNSLGTSLAWHCYCVLNFEEPYLRRKP
jgi:hypothetical protein